MQEEIIPRVSFNQEELPDPAQVEPAIQGSDGDAHTFKIACMIVGITCDFDPALSWMMEWNKRCRPPWDKYSMGLKIRDAMRTVFGSEHHELVILPEDDRIKAAKGRVSIRRINEIAFKAPGAYEEVLSFLNKGLPPIPPLEKAIDLVYPKNPWICRGRQNERWFRTDRRESIRGVEHLFEWIVPSPMSKQTGTTKGGRCGSHRCRDNAARKRRYVIVEFDYGKKFKKHIDAWAAQGITSRDVQAYLIRWLALEGEPRQWPFMIVDSGGKSLHSWYSIQKGFSERKALELLSRAIPYGADPRADLPEQFFRFPGGTRASENSQPQPILYFDETKI